MTPLMAAVSFLNNNSISSEARRYRETLDLQLELKANIETKGKKGLTALAQAAWSNNTASLGFLLQRGADYEARDEKNRTLLMPVLKKGEQHHPSICCWILAQILKQKTPRAKLLYSMRSEVRRC